VKVQPSVTEMILVESGRVGCSVFGVVELNLKQVLSILVTIMVEISKEYSSVFECSREYPRKVVLSRLIMASRPDSGQVVSS
jgi:hypothetical protein